jgi:hypothetical protein
MPYARLVDPPWPREILSDQTRYGRGLFNDWPALAPTVREFVANWLNDDREPRYCQVMSNWWCQYNANHSPHDAAGRSSKGGGLRRRDPALHTVSRDPRLRGGAELDSECMLSALRNACSVQSLSTVRYREWRRTAPLWAQSVSLVRRCKTAWRSGRDSNPRYAFDVYSLSRRAPSTTRPPLRMPFSASAP